MGSKRPPEPAREIILRSVEDWIRLGICVKCAITATAAQYLLGYTNVEDIWVASQMSELQ